MPRSVYRSRSPALISALRARNVELTTRSAHSLKGMAATISAAAVCTTTISAAASGAYHRLILDLDEETYRVERCEGKVQVKRAKDIKEEKDLEPYERLFANVDPIGKHILVGGHDFAVIGTMLRPAASFFGDTDNRVLLPYGTMHKMYPNARENAILGSYGWLDRKAGTVRIPIDRAMDLIAHRGLPATATAPAVASPRRSTP